MATNILARLEAKGHEVAITDEFRSVTWSDLNDRVNRLIGGLRGLGLAAGDAVALLGGNRCEWVDTLNATTHAGWTLVPINWHFAADEVAYVLSNSGAKALVADAEYADLASAAADQAGTEVRVMFGGAADGFADFDELLDASPASEPSDQLSGGLMLYTSGTTGRPKGVVSSANMAGGDVATAQASLEGFLEMLGLPRDGCSLVNSPLYHGGPLGFSLAPAALGSSLVMRRKWDAAETLALIDEYGIDTVYAVPTHFVRLLDLPEATKAGFDGSSLKVVFHTAAPCPPQVKREMIDWWGPVIKELYGASEGGFGMCTLIGSEDWLERPGSVGRPSPITEVIIAGEDGSSLGPGEVGTIYLRSLLGIDFEYLGDAEKTASVHHAEGGYTAGDVGYLDEDGYLFLSDRKIDMIISGGVNIYPAEIEAVLITHPAVADVAVIGVPNDEFGEEVKALVQPAAGTDDRDALAGELRAFCRDQLAGYKAPRSFEFRDLPRTPTGKLSKKLLREPYWEAAGRTI